VMNKGCSSGLRLPRAMSSVLRDDGHLSANGGVRQGVPPRAASSQMEQTDSGATTFVDATTGDRDTLQNTQIAKITKEQFDAAKDGVKPTSEPSK
jgi:hypothetical protein